MVRNVKYMSEIKFDDLSLFLKLSAIGGFITSLIILLVVVIPSIAGYIMGVFGLM